MSSAFARLAPFIQEYIYREKWTDLRPVQVQSIAAVLDTSNHILITSGTASGKTEAAFLPILTELYERPSASIGVIYIGPLKALINDQFERLESLLQEADIPVQSWHGDIDQSKKRRFVREARGILQITPESLEAMLINREADLRRLFGDLRFVVLDEVHALIGSDRGLQVLCQLQRLARYQTRPARRIGLSATLGQPELAMEWLAGGTNIPVTLIADQSGRRKVMLSVEHFVRASDEDELNLLVGEQRFLQKRRHPKVEGDLPIPVTDGVDEMFHHMAAMLNSCRKTLIFTNSRNDAEEIIHNLRRLTGVERDDEDSYFVHHGSISAALRERAEQEMRDPEKPACVAATVTLELGIDIGKLDQVLQLNATNSVSSFVQRLGRTGRRGGPARMFFYVREDELDPNAKVGRQMPWELLQTIAIIQLYLEEKWIEPPDIPSLPFSLLYHQTMSAIATHTELTPPELAEKVLSLSPFKKVTFEQYRMLLRHLLEIEHLERIEGGGLIIGPAAEKLVNSFHFYATFETEKVYVVREGSRDIGTIQMLPDVGDRIRLAGRAWKVLTVDEESNVIHVERVTGKAEGRWSGDGGVIHSRIVQRVRQVLAEKVEYGYLQPRAVERLFGARQIADLSDITREPIVPLGGNRYMLLPWLGTRETLTICLLLEHAGLDVRGGRQPFYIEVIAPSEQHIRKCIDVVLAHPPQPDALIEAIPRYRLHVHKYDRYLPEDLLRTAYCADQLNMSAAMAGLQGLVR